MMKIFVFINIWFVKQDIQKWLKTKICSFLRIPFFMENLKMNSKRTKTFLTYRSGDSNPRFSVIFPPRKVRVTRSNQNKLLKEILVLVLIITQNGLNLGPISFRSLFWFDLVTLIFGENSNNGRENYWKSGVQIPALEGQNFFCPFSVHFQILHKKTAYLCV